jgi:aspartate racemase
MFTNIAHLLNNAGADCVLMASNTPHLIADKIRKKINIPLLNIAEETAKEIIRNKKWFFIIMHTRFPISFPLGGTKQSKVPSGRY